MKSEGRKGEKQNASKQIHTPLEDDDPPMDPFEAFISEEVRAKYHNLLHQPPPMRGKRGGRGVGKTGKTKNDERLEDIQTLQDLAVEVTPATPPSPSPSSPVVALHVFDPTPQLGSANISIPADPSAWIAKFRLVASPPVSSEKAFNHLLQLGVQCISMLSALSSPKSNADLSKHIAASHT